MAEYNYENPTYDKDDYDEFDKEDMDADDEFEETIQNQSAHIAEVPQVGTRTELMVQLKQSIVKEYYEIIKRKVWARPMVVLIITNFELGPDHKTLYLKVGDEDIRISSKKGGSFISFKHFSN